MAIMKENQIDESGVKTIPKSFTLNRYIKKKLL